MDERLLSIESPTFTKAECSELMCERLRLKKRESKDLVDAFFELTERSITGGEPVRLAGFGNFETRRKAARPGRNPHTGEPVSIAAARNLSRPRQPRPVQPRCVNTATRLTSVP